MVQPERQPRAEQTGDQRGDRPGEHQPDGKRHPVQGERHRLAPVLDAQRPGLRDRVGDGHAQRHQQHRRGDDAQGRRGQPDPQRTDRDRADDAEHLEARFSLPLCDHGSALRQLLSKVSCAARKPWYTTRTYREDETLRRHV